MCFLQTYGGCSLAIAEFIQGTRLVQTQQVLPALCRLFAVLAVCCAEMCPKAAQL